MISNLWKVKGVKIWAIVSLSIMLLLLVASIIVTQNRFLYGTLNSVFNGERRVLVEGDPSLYQYYEADYKNKEEVLAAANSLNEKIVAEGITLLKNDNNALPINVNDKITVFGKNSVNLVYGGTGSSAGVSGGQTIDLYESLTSAGFTYNPTMKSFYENKSLSGDGRPTTPVTMGDILTGYPVGETPLSNYTKTVKDSYKDYNDVALVVITRIGGEGYDLPRSMFWNGSNLLNWPSTGIGSTKIPGSRNTDDHYLQLDQNETDMINEAGDNFAKVIIILNTSTTIELGFLDDENHYAYHENIKGALWIGNPGKSGAQALGKILKGEINPSGKTVDTYARDFKKSPTWNNFGNNLSGTGNQYTVDGKGQEAYMVEYEEGIYVGYRYYETRGLTEGNNPYTESINGTSTTNWDNWYQSQVVYPLGYGLSYTTFDQKIVKSSHSENAALTSIDEIKLTVKVTNTGTVAGQDVVQIYYCAPYTTGGIEKASVVLAAYGKTKVLAPGASEEIELSLTAKDMASYDYDDSNNNSFKGYELEGGNYQILLMKNAHTVIETLNVNVPAEGFLYNVVNEVSVESNNLFDNVSDYIKNRDGYLSRTNWKQTWPTRPTSERLATDKDFINTMKYTLNDKETDKWYSDEMPSQSDKVISFNKSKVKLYEMYGLDYNDPLWDELLNQLTIGQMRSLILEGSFRTLAITTIDKPLTIDADGPMGFAIFMGNSSVYDTAYYAAETVLGSTWNTELAYLMGLMIGNEGLIGDERGDGRPYSGWYAPAANIHRSQFGGRNFEYYSEDGLLSGKMASSVIKGAKEKGVYTFLKHFALNEQETRRDSNGLITWANEQSMRELYFLPFEIAVKEGETSAIMSSFNRVGTEWAGGNYALLTELLREEWGFNGMVITDFNLSRYMNVDQMIRAGGDLSLSADKGMSSDASATSVQSLRRATKNILYTVANSNAMNGMGEGVIYKYIMPQWVEWLIMANVGVLLACSGIGFFVIKNARKKINIKGEEI